MLEWRPFCANESICSRFNISEWHKMVTDVDSDSEWSLLLSEYSHFIKCYVLYRIESDEPIAFVYTLQEDNEGKVVSFHGGGWNKSMYHTLLYYKGAIMFIKTLLNLGLKVRTSCLIDNIPAFRFLKSIGFVCYRTTNKWHYFWINTKRLEAGKIQKFLLQRGLN